MEFSRKCAAAKQGALHLTKYVRTSSAHRLNTYSKEEPEKEEQEEDDENAPDTEEDQPAEGEAGAQASGGERVKSGF